MKKIILICFFSSFLFLAFSLSTTQECNSTELKKAARALLKPYKYDSAKLTKYTFKDQPQKLEVEVPLFIGEKYRFIFNSQAMNQKIGISIYNKKNGSKKRELLFSNESIPDSQEQFMFEPGKGRKLFVNYDIPANQDSVVKKGCVLFLVGFE